MEKIGQNIKKIRELKNYTQEYIANKLNISRVWYIKIENDDTDIKFEQLKKVAEILDVSLNDIISFDDKVLFNNNRHIYDGENGSNIINNYPFDEMKTLYEKLLSEKEQRIQDKDAIIKELKEIINRNK